MPDTWQQRTIAELCEMVKGSAPISKTKEGPFPLVTTGAERKTADHYQFDAAAVCVPMISSTGHGHASLKRVHYQEGKFALANLLTALIVRDQTTLSPRFLHLYLNFYKDQLLVPLQAGAANMSITVGRLATVPIRFPSLAEQERILQILDEADELRRLRAQADRRTADLSPAIFYEVFGDPETNPKGWDSKLLSQACEKITDGTHFSPPIESTGVPYITAKHLKSYGLDFESDPWFISEENHRAIYARGDPRIGDVLYIKDGATTGIAAVNYYHFEFSMLSSLALLRPAKRYCTTEYLCAWLNNPLVKQSMIGNVAGAAITRLTLTKIKEKKILIPPLPLQQQFAARAAEVRALEESQAASRRKLDALFDSLLHRAFKGEL